MVASKVTISQETRARLDVPALTHAKRIKLREELVKDCIRNSVGGYATKQELCAAAGFDPDARSTGYAAGVGLINNMVKRGIISHNNTNQFRKAWVVVADIKSATKPTVTPAPEQVAKTILEDKQVVVELKEFNMNKLTLVDMAKQFAWVQNSDSLREFIKHIENAIK